VLNNHSTHNRVRLVNITTKEQVVDTPVDNPPMCSILAQTPESVGQKVLIDGNCDLGQWFTDQARKSGKKTPLFWGIGRLHSQLHLLAMEIKQAESPEINPDNLQAMINFKSLWEELSKMLAEIRSENR
jgi:hypothetical protein